MTVIAINKLRAAAAESRGVELTAREVELLLATLDDWTDKLRALMNADPGGPVVVPPSEAFR